MKWGKDEKNFTSRSDGTGQTRKKNTKIMPGGKIHLIIESPEAFILVTGGRISIISLAAR